MSKTTSKSSQARRREQMEKKQRQQNRWIRIFAAVLGVVAIGVIGLFVWQALRDDSGTAGAEGSTEAAAGGSGALMPSDRTASELDPASRDGMYSEYPTTVIKDNHSYEAVIVTDKGDIRLALFAEEAPQTVNSFVFLANEGFYDGVSFHRVLEDFMAQGGDPSGTGGGGPGYEFGDETDNGLTFDRPGLLAMANRGPGTNGSQFFITYVPTPHLNGGHTIFGEVTEGMEVVDALTRRDPSAPNQPPPDFIQRVEIYETSP